jgi:hypothetical protein
VRSLRVAPVSQTALDLGQVNDSASSSVLMAAERGWWRLSEQARVEVIALLARLIARGVLVEDPPTSEPAARVAGDQAGEETGAGAGAGERRE